MLWQTKCMKSAVQTQWFNSTMGGIMVVDERVLVVPRSNIFAAETQQGFISKGIDEYLDSMKSCYRFESRATVENDSSLKQIIPYVVFVHEDTVFLVRRSASQSEKRLVGKHSIGIGGHINRGDAKDGPHQNVDSGTKGFTDTLTEGLHREIREEVYVGENPRLSLVGLINDDSTPVGQVHLGLVYIASLSAKSVTVRETELMAGSFVPIDALDRYYGTMETWSQIVVDSGCLDRSSIS